MIKLLFQDKFKTPQELPEAFFLFISIALFFIIFVLIQRTNRLFKFYMRKIILPFLLLVCFSSCEEGDSSAAKVEKQEINQVVDGEKEGLHQIRKSDGSLRNEIRFVNGKRHGLSTDFYDTGEKRMDINYVEGVKNGDVTWYHRSGEVYRVNPYVDGYVQGVQKKFYENGQQLSELEFFQDLPGVGLKEWDRSGNEKKFKYTLKSKRVGSRVQVQLSSKKQNAEFFIGDLKQNKFMHIGLKDVTLGEGVGEFGMDEFKGKSTLDIIVKYPTYNKNPMIFVGTIKKSQL